MWIRRGAGATHSERWRRRRHHAQPPRRTTPTDPAAAASPAPPSHPRVREHGSRDVAAAVADDPARQEPKVRSRAPATKPLGVASLAHKARGQVLCHGALDQVLANPPRLRRAPACAKSAAPRDPSRRDINAVCQLALGCGRRTSAWVLLEPPSPRSVSASGCNAMATAATGSLPPPPSEGPRLPEPPRIGPPRALHRSPDRRAQSVRRHRGWREAGGGGRAGKQVPRQLPPRAPLAFPPRSPPPDGLGAASPPLAAQPLQQSPSPSPRIDARSGRSDVAAAAARGWRTRSPQRVRARGGVRVGRGSGVWNFPHGLWQR
eukprot:354535-Chlamydomonas_euryale.AAC.3